jgi:hypothetical protein
VPDGVCDGVQPEPRGREAARMATMLAEQLLHLGAKLVADVAGEEE